MMKAHKIAIVTGVTSLSIMAVTLAKSAADVMVDSTRQDTRASIACIFNEEEIGDLEESSKIVLASSIIPQQKLYSRVEDSILNATETSGPNVLSLPTLVSSEVLSQRMEPAENAANEDKSSPTRTDPIEGLVEIAPTATNAESISTEDDDIEDNDSEDNSSDVVILENNDTNATTESETMEEVASEEESISESDEAMVGTLEISEEDKDTTISTNDIKESTVSANESYSEKPIEESEEEDEESNSESDEAMVGTLEISEEDKDTTISTNDIKESTVSANESYSDKSIEESEEIDTEEALVSEDPFIDENNKEEVSLTADQIGESVDYFTEWTDLINHRQITANEMNFIIDDFVGNRNSSLTDTGDAFIIASQETGYDPIFLLCLAAQESSWTTSAKHIDKNNPYSINMTDANPYGGFNMGESWEDGIVGGARWIKEKYYDEGYTTLNGMINGGKRYSSSGDAWIDAICSNMNKCYRVLRKYERG